MAKQEKSAAEIYREERKARLAKAAKKNAKKSISSSGGDKAAKVIAVLLVIALVGGICGVGINLSGIVQRNRTAIVVGEEKVSQPEYSYYYTNIYQSYANYANYGYSIGFDPYTAPESQEYPGYFGEIEGFPEDETPMWSDFFKYNVERQLQYIKACVAEAKTLGLELDDEHLANVQSTIDSLEESAASSNFSLSAYLRKVVGKGMTKGIFEEILKEQEIAEMVEEYKTEEFEKSYTDDEVASEYKDNIINYAVVSLRSYEVTAETVTDEETGIAAATDETMAAAKKTADELVSKATDEASFKTAISEIEKANGNDDYEELITDDSLTLQEDVDYSTLSGYVYDEDFLEWAFSDDTKSNSTYTVEEEDTGYTVYMMVDPLHKPADKSLYDVRHILISFPEEEETEEDTVEVEETADAEETADTEEAADTEDTAAETEATEAETAEEEVEVTTLDISKYSDVTIDLDVTAETATDKATYKKAQDILEEYLNGDRTAEAFGELAKEYTDDTNGDDGGLYSDVEEGYMVTEFENWCLDDSRKEGDVGIVETQYGYHIMYFVDSSVKTWEDTVREALASDDLAEYQEEMVSSESVAISGENEKAITEVKTFLSKLIKEQASYDASELIG